MNFEFLMSLKGLDKIYKTCKDAEDLAISKPNMSIISSRKSAELLAKFIYLVAHFSAVEDINFVDILRDKKVQQFVNDRNVMQAFHCIRKNGNEAVHDDKSEFGSNQAVDLLEKLHYIVGETAIRLKLIDKYPPFDAAIEENPNATFVDNEQIAKQAQEMFQEYVKTYEYQKYSEHFVEFDWQNKAHRDYYLHGMVEMHEYLEFKHKPFYCSTVEYIQQYLIFISDLAFERSQSNQDSFEADTVSGNITIGIDGSIVYSGNLRECGDSIGKLSEAQNFSIDCHLSGNLRVIHDLPDSNFETDAINEDELWQGRGMSDYLDSIKRREKFTYKQILYYPDDSNQTIVCCIRNGKTIDVPLNCNLDFQRKLSNQEWYADSLSMYIDFDHHAYPEILEKLHNAVSELLTEDELPYVQELWEDAEEDPRWLFSGNTIISKDLSEVDEFVKRFNVAVEPIAQKCTIFFNEQRNTASLLKTSPEALSPKQASYAKSLIEEGVSVDPAVPDFYHCFYNMDQFAVAALIWKDHKLQLVGTLL